MSNETLWQGDEAVCPGCGSEIDPDICWCGEAVKDHGWHDNHTAVPMGCICGYPTGPVEEDECNCDACQCWGEGSCQMDFDPEDI